ncbi:MAG: VWA domain-containing protein [Acidobacteriota bacterium]
MSFVTPLALGFLGTLPVITLLYFLKLRRKKRVVPATLLWERAIREMRANTPFQRLRVSSLLLLQLLLATLLAFALARPYMRGAERLAAKRILILDTSASMNARSGSGTRFDAARAQAASLVLGQQPGEETMLLVSAPRPRVLKPFTSDVGALRREIATCRPSEAPGDLSRALALALALTSKDESRDIVIVTDRAEPPVAKLPDGTAGVRMISIGEDAPNMGICSFDAIPSPVSPTDWEVFVGVVNQSASAASCRVVVELGSEAVDARAIDVPPRETRGVVVPIHVAGAQAVSARIEPAGPDALACDDAAHGILAPPRRRRVTIISPSGSVDPWLARALGRNAGLEVEGAPLGTKLSAGASDLVIFDGVTPISVPPGGYLFLDPNGQVDSEGVELFHTGASADYPSILDWDRRSDLLRYVTFGDVHVRRAHVVVPGEGSQAIAEIEGGPVLAAGRVGSTRFLAVGFDYRASDLPYRAAFPILIGNALGILCAGDDQARPFSYAAGKTIDLPVAASVGGDVTVKGPSGIVSPVRRVAGRLLWDGADRVGLHQVLSGKEVVSRVGVSLLSQEESNLEPRADLVVAKGAGQHRAIPSVSRELAPWLLLLALVVLSVEWLVYHRRSYA